MDGEWDKTTLGEHIEIKHGFAFKGEFFRDQGEGDILVTPGNFRVGGGFADDKLKRYVGPEAPGYLLSAGETIVTMTDLSKAGDTLGYSAKVPADGRRYLHNQRIGRVVRRTNTSLNLSYVNWLMRTSDYRHHVLGAATGSTVKHTSPSRIHAYSFRRPPIDEQGRIAAFLDAVDDKIGLNRRMGRTLEGVARAVFRSWFIDFDPVRAKVEGRDPGLPANVAALFPDSFGEEGLPKGWTYRRADQIGKLVRNGVEPRELDPATAYIGLEHLPKRQLVLESWGTASEANSVKSGFIAGDLLFGKLRPYFHKVSVAPRDGICSSDIFVFRPITEGNRHFMYFAFSEENFVASAAGGVTGTRMPRAEWKHMGAQTFVVAPTGVMDAFSAISQSLLSSINLKIEEASKLIQLRDTLLPSLISGKLRLPDAAEEAAAA